jgi:hypothetical protein
MGRNRATACARLPLRPWLGRMKLRPAAQRPVPRRRRSCRNAGPRCVAQARVAAPATATVRRRGATNQVRSRLPQDSWVRPKAARWRLEAHRSIPVPHRWRALGLPTLPRGNLISRPLTAPRSPRSISRHRDGNPPVEGDMIEDADITFTKILRAIARLTDAELLQLKAAARKEAERRGLKESRHAVATDTRR